VLSLVAILAILAVGAALQFAQSYRKAAPGWVSVLWVAAALLFVVIGLPAAVAGNGAQITLTDPVPEVAISFVATASGYTILGLSLVGALILMAREDSRRNPTLLMSLVGVAIACLGGSLFTLACGAEIVAFSGLFGAKSQASNQLRYWLELSVTQTAIACFIGAACWYQLQVSTTSFSVLPAGAANVASLTWSLGIVLLAFASVLAGSAKTKGLAHAVVVLGPLLALNAVRLNQVASNGLNAGSITILVTGGCLLGAVALVQIWRASKVEECTHWLWAGAMVPLLFVTAEVQDSAGTALGALTVTLFVSGILLALISTSEKLGVSKSLGLLAVVGLPFGSVLPGWISSGVVLAGSPSARALAWILIGFAALYFVIGVRMAVMARESGFAWQPRNMALTGFAMICVVASLLPGVTASSVFAWIGDNSVTSPSAFNLPLAGNNSWPGGLVTAASLALFAIAFSSATILGTSPRTSKISGGVPEESTAPHRLNRFNKLLTKLGHAVTNVDDWLAVEPRLVTVVLAGVVALAVFR
jgi:hypothetical protein